MYANLDKMKLAYTDQGKGMPVVFLHAFPLNRTMWGPQIAACSAQYRAIAVDLRGHGESDAPPGQYSLTDLAADVNALLDQLAIPQAVLVGLSMGGYVLFAFYRQYRRRVKALVLADTRAAADSEEVRASRMQMIQAANTEGAGPIAEIMLTRLLSPAGQQNPELVQAVRSQILTIPVRTITRDLVAMAERPDSSSMLKEIVCPTLVIVGEFDQGTPPSEARRMAEAIPGARLEIIPAAGHLSNLEQPEAFNRALLSFLQGIS